VLHPRTGELFRFQQQVRVQVLQRYSGTRQKGGEMVLSWRFLTFDGFAGKRIKEPC
jgi:hypothetical protein